MHTDKDGCYYTIKSNLFAMKFAKSKFSDAI